MLSVDIELWVDGQVVQRASAVSERLRADYCNMTFSFALEQPAALIMVVRALGPSVAYINTLKHFRRPACGDRNLAWRGLTSTENLSALIRTAHGCSAGLFTSNLAELTVERIAGQNILGIISAPDSELFARPLDRYGVRLHKDDIALWCLITAFEDAVIDIVVELWTEACIAQCEGRWTLQAGQTMRCSITLPQDAPDTVPVLFLSTKSGQVILTAIGIERGGA